MITRTHGQDGSVRVTDDGNDPRQPLADLREAARKQGAVIVEPEQPKKESSEQ